MLLDNNFMSGYEELLLLALQLTEISSHLTYISLNESFAESIAVHTIISIKF